MQAKITKAILLCPDTQPAISKIIKKMVLQSFSFTQQAAEGDIEHTFAYQHNMGRPTQQTRVILS